VNVGSTATINAVLKIGSATESVTVTSDASQLQTESSDIGTTVSSALIEDLPLQYAGARAILCNLWSWRGLFRLELQFSNSK